MSTSPILPYVAYDLDQIVEHAPILRLRANDGTDALEQQVLVGHVCAPESARGQLEGYAIFMDLAHYDRRAKRWNRCLFSVESANTLAELGTEGQFPYSFEAIPSAGHLTTLEAVAEGRPNPELALREWVTPASLEALAGAVARGLIQPSWLRRSEVGKSK